VGPSLHRPNTPELIVVRLLQAQSYGVVPNAQPRLLEIKLRALHAYEAWQAFAGLDLHLLAWSFGSASLYAYPLDVVRTLMRSRPVERFHDTHDEFVSIPLPKEPVDLNRW
jgi:hypothetical protein